MNDHGTLACALELKSVSDVGTFEGYASTFGNVDLGGDIVERGAFTAWLSKSTDTIPALWSHDARDPIGVYEDIVEDRKGLKVRGRLAVPDVRRAREVHALMKMGAVKGLSIGYYARDYETDKKGVRHLKALDVEEVSLATFPMNPRAKVSSVKSLTTARDLEAFLVDAGLSRRDAKRVVAEGFKGLSLRDAGGPEQACELSLRDADGSDLLGLITEFRHANPLRGNRHVGPGNGDQGQAR